jgi:hypothetical protein
MSDLQDAIAATCVKAFNQGYARGADDERERVLRLAKEASISNHIGEFVYLSDLEEYIVFADKEKSNA